MFKTLIEWLGFDPIERPRHPEVRTMPRTLFDSDLSKQVRKTAIDRDIEINDRNLGRDKF
jgi:hypothetical protein